jgi:alkanesulfonate monooxygenase SsuD/methylene tetrahydromethanopterin reductase-like flavin-dependent oxidoreductase (luciferase family)
MTTDELQFGFVATCQAPLTSSLAEYAAGEIRLVHAVRDAGWDAVWVVHHYLPDVMRMPQPAPWLGRLIGETGELQLGTSILVLPLLNPLDVAETYGALDALSGGRLVLGVGLGYRAEEFEAFGLDISERVRRFTGNLQALLALWESPNGSADVDLPWCRIESGVLGARPVQRPRPPVLVGANKEVAIRRAARLADGWLISPFSRRDTVLAQLGIFHEARAAAGRPPVTEFTLGREVFCAPTREEAYEVARTYLGDKYSAYAQWRGSSSTHHVDAFEEFARDRFVLGSPDDCVAALLPYLAAGVNHVKVRTRWLGMGEAEAASSIALFSSEVIPPLRAAWKSMPAPVGQSVAG